MLLEEYLTERTTRLYVLESMAKLATTLSAAEQDPERPGHKAHADSKDVSVSGKEEDQGREGEGAGSGQQVLTLQQVVVIVRTLFPANCAASDAAVALRLFRTAYCRGRGQVTLGSLVEAVGCLRLMNVTLRLPLQQVTQSGMASLTDATETLHILLKEHRGLLMQLNSIPIGPMARLVDLPLADPPAESISGLFELLLRFLRVVCNSRAFQITRPVAHNISKPGPGAPPLTHMQKMRMTGRLNDEEEKKWRHTFRNLLEILRVHLGEIEPPEH